MAQPDISQILAQLSQLTPAQVAQVAQVTERLANLDVQGNQQQAGTSQAPTPQHGAPMQPPPQQQQQQGPPGMYGAHMPMPAHSPHPGPPQGYLPPPSNTGSVDLSAVRPANTGSMNIQEAIARAKSIAAEKSPHLQSQARQSPRGDPRLAGRGYAPPTRSRSRSPARRDNYGGNPYREERRDDPRRGGGGGYPRRSDSPDRNFRGSRDPPSGYRSNDGETETIRVKSALVGLIIGRNGESLRKVESDSGARVQFLQAKTSHTSERECTISGSLRAREAAKTAIYSIIDENGGSNIPSDKGAYTAGMPGRAKVNLPALREGEAQTQMMVPDKTVGLIIGRGGETIKDLQERSGCHVNIVGENKSVNGLRPVNLIGSAHATALAKELILEIVDSDSRNGTSGGGGGAGSNQAQPQRDRGYGDFNRGSGGGGGGRDHVEKTIQVPSESVGMIIGKGGETIKDMQRTSGCKINVNQPKPPDVTRDIDLAGTAQAMAEAERAIWDKVDTVRQRDANGGGRRQGGGGRNQEQRGGGGGGYDGYSQQPQGGGYGQYGSPQQGGYGNVPPQMPPFQMPGMQQQQPQAPQQSAAEDPYAAYGGQQAVYAWYAQQMAQAQAQQGQQGPPGTGQ